MSKDNVVYRHICENKIPSKDLFPLLAITVFENSDGSDSIVFSLAEPKKDERWLYTKILTLKRFTTGEYEVIKP